MAGHWVGVTIVATDTRLLPGPGTRGSGTGGHLGPGHPRATIASTVLMLGMVMSPLLLTCVVVTGGHHQTRAGPTLTHCQWWQLSSALLTTTAQPLSRSLSAMSGVAHTQMLTTILSTNHLTGYYTILPRNRYCRYT